MEVRFEKLLGILPLLFSEWMLSLLRLNGIVVFLSNVDFHDSSRIYFLHIHSHSIVSINDIQMKEFSSKNQSSHLFLFRWSIIRFFITTLRTTDNQSNEWSIEEEENLPSCWISSGRIIILFSDIRSGISSSLFITSSLLTSNLFFLFTFFTYSFEIFK